MARSNLVFSIGKCENNLDFSETIAACDLNVGRCRQLIELMKFYKYSMSLLFLDRGGRSFTYENVNENELTFLRNHWAILNQILYVSF